MLIKKLISFFERSDIRNAREIRNSKQALAFAIYIHFDQGENSKDQHIKQEVNLLVYFCRSVGQTVNKFISQREIAVNES